MEVDSNHRSNLQQIYSLSPLATRESIQNIRYTRNGTYRARTCDPLLVRQMLSQLSYAPELPFIISTAELEYHKILFLSTEF